MAFYFKEGDELYTQSDMSQIYKISDDEIKLLATILGNSHNQYGISSKTTAKAPAS